MNETQTQIQAQNENENEIKKGDQIMNDADIKKQNATDEDWSFEAHADPDYTLGDYEIDGSMGGSLFGLIAEVITVELGERSASPLHSAETEALIDGSPFPVSVEKAYRDLLFHGPLMQGIRSIEAISPNGITATLKPSSPGRYLVGGAEGR